VLPLELLLGGNQAIVKLLAVGHLRCAGWPLFMLAAVPVRVGDQHSWWGEWDWTRVGVRNDHT
jgi:hypothetical protein